MLLVWRTFGQADLAFRLKSKDVVERFVIFDNIRDRDFQADWPNQKWLADFTYVWTAVGRLFVALGLELFSGRSVGWPMKADRDASLLMDAFTMAVWLRGKADALLHFWTMNCNTPVHSYNAWWPTMGSPA